MLKPLSAVSGDSVVQVDAHITRLQRALDVQQVQIEALQQRHEELRAEIEQLKASGPSLAVASAVRSLPSSADLLQKKLSTFSCGDEAERPTAAAEIADAGDSVLATAPEAPAGKRRRPSWPGLQPPASGVSTAVVHPQQDAEVESYSAVKDECELQLTVPEGRLEATLPPPRLTAIVAAAEGARLNASGKPLEAMLQSWTLASLFLRLLGLYTTLQLKGAASSPQKAIAKLNFAFPLWFPAKIYAIGGSSSCNQGAPLSSVELLHPEAGSWECLPALHVPRKYAAAACTGGYVYVAGGHNGHRTLVEVERFNECTRLWEAMPCLREPRYASSAACWQGCLYVIGGHSGRECLSSTERLDLAAPFERRWEPAPNLQMPRMSASAVKLGGTLFVIGGMRSWETAHASAEQLMLSTWAWEERPLPRPNIHRLSTCTTVVGSTIVCAGGHAEKDKKMKPCGVVEGLAPDSEAGCPVWRELPPLQVFRSGASAVAANGQVIVLGGSAAGEALQSVESLRLEDNSWRELPALGVPRVAMSAVASRLS